MTDSDADFLRWVAGWLDTVDPILKAVFYNAGSITDGERERIRDFLDGTDVQERIRNIADSLVPPDPTPEGGADA